ncbi:hypothetical protein V2G26_000250 [Clonostachys chloroleuca]
MGFTSETFQDLNGQPDTMAGRASLNEPNYPWTDCHYLHEVRMTMSNNEGCRVNCRPTLRHLRIQFAIGRDITVYSGE